MAEEIKVILTAISSSGIIIIIVSLLVCYLGNGDSRKYYKQTYNVIKSGEYVVVKDDNSHGVRLKYFVPLNFIHEYYRCRDQIILFHENKKPSSIKLLSPGDGNHYIHNHNFPMIDFYARYWFKKILKAMNEQGVPITHVNGPTKIRNFKFLK